MATYLKPEVRKEQILTAAMTVAERDGYMHMRRSDVAESRQAPVLGKL